MLFTVKEYGAGTIPAQFPCGFLEIDNWDDWFAFNTMYNVVIFDEAGHRVKLGSIKIGQFEMRVDQKRPDIPPVFEMLNEQFFSLGQDDSYYEQLNGLSPDVKQAVLRGLNDIAFDEGLFELVLNEKVTTESLLRSVSESTVRRQFRRIIRGGARLSPYFFSYQLPMTVGGEENPPVFIFNVVPDSEPPSNVHVLIGSNGVGKTFLLDRMARAIVGHSNQADHYGRFEFSREDDDSRLEGPFAGVVSVSFSAFDQFSPVLPQDSTTSSTRFAYVGLKAAGISNDNLAYRPKSPQEFAAEFADSSGKCRFSTRVDRWVRALQALEADPTFSRERISNIATRQWVDDQARRLDMIRLFDNLSSGHKLVLLTVARLVEEVEERTLVLLDEPEAHLHPPLLATFIRALSELLINRNGVAIVATHSPVVLQEVPASCVWKLARYDSFTSASRPDIETFGENVGVLTREVFGLEVTESGFHKMLATRVASSFSYEQALEAFNGQLGGEARAIMRVLISEREGYDEL